MPLNWALIPNSNIEILGGNWLAAGAGQEGYEVSLFKEALADVDTVIDVGANSGIFSCVAAAAGKTVYAFEPMPQTMRILARTIERNKLGERIEVYPIAVCDRVGIARFFGKGQGASLIEGWAGQPSYDAIHLPTNTLDNLLASRLVSNKVFLKIDVEGAELEVLKGAAQVLAKCTGILLENGLSKNVPGGKNASYAAIFAFLDDLGFNAWVAEPNGIPVTPALARQWADAGQAPVVTMNYIFRRKES